VEVADAVLRFLIEARALEPALSSSHAATVGNSEDAGSNSRLKISRFGRAVMQSGISPDEAIVLYEDLRRALNGLNLESDLHLLYLVAPLERGLYPDFQKLCKWYSQSQRAPRERCLWFVCESAGITEALLSKWAFQPPGKAVVRMSAETVRGLSLAKWDWAGSTAETPGQSAAPASRGVAGTILPDSEWKVRRTLLLTNTDKRPPLETVATFNFSKL
jgi:hypothetical protein